ncbi:MAG: cation:proton antiporter, partial [Muribaculaceae bacterium]|nr:cation:proton antiporter [Muribaculaceae bacterium]
MNIESLISDLAFILLLGAGVTVLFKWIKQPVVLGYIVAGFLASPNFEPLPSVTTEANIEFWAQIGIVVLLFSLGLEFSFKKLLNVGGSAVVTALIIVAGMMITGFMIGKLLHFSNINSLFLGGMLSMSSTTIIIKAFTDLNLRQKKFASLVFAVLIVEDLFAVVMMVLLSSLAAGDNVEGGEMLFSIGKLVFFLIIWFLVGVYVLPSVFNKTRNFLNNETLLVVSMGLCLGMAVFSVACGFSLALGAFVMGSILAGTNIAERIEHVTTPVKDLFGAVFFISVGMMVQPAIIAEYWGPILLLSAVVIIGMIIFGTAGMLITGQSLKVAIESGFSLTQIGEFAFIIASLGMSLGVLEPTIYPIVVAVSVITTFTTPYFIKLADPAYRVIERILPRRLHFLIDRYTEDATKAGSTSSAWVQLIKRYLWRVLLYSIVLIAITIVSQHYLMPWITSLIPGWGKIIGTVITLGAMAPFLLALCLSTSKRAERLELEPYKVPRAVMMLFRIAIAMAFIVHFLGSTYSMAVGASVGVALVLLFILLLSSRVRSRMRSIETTFIKNLNERDLSKSGRNNNLVGNLHLARMVVSSTCRFVGEKLMNTDLHRLYGVNVVNIQRGSKFIAAPSGSDRLFPGDVVGIIGTDEQLQAILPILE